MSQFDLEKRLLRFASDVILLTDKMPKTRAGNHIASQMLRSGTSPYPNHGEAQAAESRKDFIHKVRVCLKELRETLRWLNLIAETKMISDQEVLTRIRQENDELIRIFMASIRTASSKQ